MSRKSIEFARGDESVTVPARVSKGLLHITESDDIPAHTYRIARHGETGYRLLGENETVRGYAQKIGDEVWVHVDGQTFRLEVIAGTGGRQRRAGAAKDEILAPMTGTVRKVLLEAGADVTAGTPAIVLEAMKMEHVLKIPRDGQVAEIGCSEGEQAEAQSILLRMAPEAEGE